MLPWARAFAACVAVVWVLAVLFGAPPFARGTGAFVALQAALAAAPAAAALRGLPARDAAVLVADPAAWPSRAPALLPAAGALAGAWLAAACLRLDKPELGEAWIARWQAWPAASCLGAVLGAAVGAVAAAAAVWRRRRQLRLDKRQGA